MTQQYLPHCLKTRGSMPTPPRLSPVAIISVSLKICLGCVPAAASLKDINNRCDAKAADREISCLELGSLLYSCCG